MIKIRKNVFETNSSSSHSLVYSKKDRGYSHCMPLNEDGNLIVEFREYGWGPDVLNTPYEKLCYVFTRIAIDYDWEEYMNQNEYDRVVPEGFLEDSRTQIILNALERNCGISLEDIIFEAPDRYFNIDHLSANLLDKEDISDIIFNNSILILIDNDNSLRFEGYFTDWIGNPPEKDIEELFNE